MVEPTKCSIAFDRDGDPSAGSFLFDGETHTIANAVRQSLIANPKVEFSSYAIPHPAEQRMRFRIQARAGESITAVMDEALHDLARWCEATEAAFDAEMSNFLGVSK